MAYDINELVVTNEETNKRIQDGIESLNEELVEKFRKADCEKPWSETSAWDKEWSNDREWS